MALEMKSQGESFSSRVLRGRVNKHWTRNSRSFLLDAEFQVREGITILFGPSGAGKTTLLDCIAGVTEPDSGKITVGGKVFFDSSSRQSLPIAHRGIGYVFQDLALFPHMTAVQNVEYGLRGDAKARRQQMQVMMDSLGIAHLAERRPAEISGGERQRVALARALATNPCLLLLDEPLAALDAPTKSRILDDLRRWNEAHGIPILYVTHSREEVFALGERMLMLEAGKITAEGTPHQVMRAPRHETVAQLAGFENIFDAAVVAVHEERGTMTCRIAESQVELETPVVRAEAGDSLRIGIRAGDILLATQAPTGLSARNVIPGTIEEVSVRDVIVSVRVNCGVRMEAHLTLAARDSLALAATREVWLIVKTHSCHLMAA